MILDDQIASINSDKQLLINFQPLNARCMISPWDDGVHFHMWDDNKWIVEEIDPGFVLISDDYTEKNSLAVFQYMQQFPKSLKMSIKPFSQNQFTLLTLFSRYPSLIDIFAHSLNLVWMVIVSVIKERWAIEEIVKLLHQRREKIAEKIFQSKSKTIISFINKVQLLNGDNYEYRLIKDCCNNTDVLEFFSHWKIIPVHALVLVRMYSIIIKTNLLPDLLDLDLTLYKQQTAFSSTASIIKDIQLMADMIDFELSDRYLKNLKTIAKVNRAHDRLIDRVNNSKEFLNSNTVYYPICPLGDTDNIIQIKNNIALASEGRAMHHCVAGYGSSLLEEKSYIYKVINPERGTLHISRNGDNFDINQFKLVCNGPPSNDSYKIIRQWLKQKERK